MTFHPAPSEHLDNDNFLSAIRESFDIFQCPACGFVFDSTGNELEDLDESLADEFVSRLCEECAFDDSFDHFKNSAVLPQSSLTGLQQDRAGRSIMSSPPLLSSVNPVGELFFDGLQDRPSCHNCINLDSTVKCRPPFEKAFYHSSSPKIFYRGSEACHDGGNQVLVLTPAGNFMLCPHVSNHCGKPKIDADSIRSELLQAGLLKPL